MSSIAANCFTLCLLTAAVVHSFPSSSFQSGANQISSSSSSSFRQPRRVQNSPRDFHWLVKGQSWPASRSIQHLKAKRGEILDDSDSKSSLLIGEAPPKLIEARQYGKTVLECSASGTPAPEITWYKDGKPLIKELPRSRMSDGDYGEFMLESMSETMSRIAIDCVSEEDAGIYECVARTNKKKKSVGTQVHVVSFEPNGCVPRHLLNFQSSPPRIFQWMGTYLQKIGTDARLICRAEGGHETIWLGPTDLPVEADRTGKYKTLENGDLLIRNLTFDDMGMFKCLVRNKMGEDMKETFVYPHLPEE